MKNQGTRRKELDRLGGVVTSARRSGDVFTGRVKFEDKGELARAVKKLRGLGWGVSVDGDTLRCLVVVG